MTLLHHEYHTLPYYAMFAASLSCSLLCGSLLFCPSLLQESRGALQWAAMLSPQCQDFALSFIARRVAVQLPSRTFTTPTVTSEKEKEEEEGKEEDFFSSSLSHYIPFLKELFEQTFPLRHVSMRTLLEVLVLQLRCLAAAIETIDESDSRLDMNREAKHATQALAMIHVSRIICFLIHSL
jgi:hypothetical protein